MTSIMRAISLRWVRATLVLFLSSAGSVGCLVVTLQPIYDQQTLEFDDALVGVWRNAEDDVVVTLERGAWNAYHVIYKEGSREEKFTAYRTRIGGAVFVDLGLEAGVEPGSVLIPVHVVFRIEVDGKRMQMRGLNYDWFVDTAERRQLGSLAFAIDAKRNVVLTSGTREIRDWLAAHLKRDAAFSDPVTLVRD